MELKREEQLIRDDTGKYQDPYLDSVFMTAISEVYLAIKEAGYEPYDQLTGYVRTGNEQYITRRHNARKIVTEMDELHILKASYLLPTSGLQSLAAEHGTLTKYIVGHGIWPEPMMVSGKS